MRPLEGIRVLDLSRLLPGPLATLVLADLGATVDKVEDPDLGDYTRLATPQVGGASVAFHALNRGKRSIVLDLKAQGGAAALLRLARSYDVIVDQFRPGVMDRLGIGHRTLLDENPRLVVCALTGYGQTGPLRDRAGHDLNYLARAGILGLMGPVDRAPQLPSFQLADVSGGMWSVIGILAALRERDRTGKGGLIDVSMTDSVVPFAAVTLGKLLGGEEPVRGGEYVTGGIAAYNTYATKDGESITLGALEPKFLQRFCKGAGIAFEPMAIVPGEHQRELKATYAAVFASKTRAEWEAFGLEHDCCIEPVLRPDELLGDAQLGARGVFVEANTAAGSFHQFRTPVTPHDLVPGPGPGRAEHTDAILREGGFSDAEIAALRTSRVVE
ncbi:MAG TPA: CaiB/BaiF CoA-transferase family protein [Polyangiaceae bacterium]|jgi:crotonobetainyl-CoA:carnitine CoA-transferase CaiB-like acyl-CoA transferase|nr:CaiB/BaiF CoA-transferase family protein [Polyangiaceae bacterium]